nr:flagella basal body P-ring formation protein FlgA [Motilimonas cestriensis]
MRSNCHRTISRCLVEVIQEESIIYYWFSVSAKARAFVPKYTLNGGARVEPKMFESKLVNIFVCDSVASLEQIANQRLVRKVSKNKALCLEDLEPAPVFVKGEEAVLIYNNGGFDIFVSVIVMDDVFIGNYAHVRIPGSGKSLRARLEKDKQFYMGNYK